MSCNWTYSPLCIGGKFQGTILMFLRANAYRKWRVNVSKKPANCEDGKWMLVHCLLQLFGQNDTVGISKDQINIKKNSLVRQVSIKIIKLRNNVTIFLFVYHFSIH